MDLPILCMKRSQPNENEHQGQRVFILENSGEIDSTCKKMKVEKDLSLLIDEFSKLDPSADPNISTKTNH